MCSHKPVPDVLERLERAERLKIQGSHHDALKILEGILLEDPENVSALEEIADNELSLGQFRRAEAAAKRALALDDQSYTGHYIIGFLRSRASNWPAAISSLQRANALKPSNPEILRCLGWALFCGGKRAQGLVTLERALNLDSDSSLTLCDLGVLYLQLHHFVKAKSLFIRSLDLEPRNERAKECLRTAERLLKIATPRREFSSLKHSRV